MAGRSQRTKITLADMGDPSMVKTLPKDENVFVLGTIIGIASGFVERQNPDKTQTFEGLKGQFRAISSNPDIDEIESGVMFIPEAFHNMVAEKLRNAQENDKSAEIRFAFEVASIRAGNPQGYSWQLQPLVDDTTTNPLDQYLEFLKTEGGELGKKTQLAIEHRSNKAAEKKNANKKK